MKNQLPASESMMHVVGLIYACANDAGRVPEMLRELNTLLAATATQLFTRDIATGAVIHSQMSETAHPDANRRYVSYWGTSDPRTPLLATLAPRQVLRCHEHFDDVFVAGSRFYHDFLVAHGLRWSIAARYPGAPGMENIVAVMRAPRMPAFEDWTVTALGMLLPHFERAAFVAMKLERHAAAVQAATQMLRQLPLPCLFTDQVGRCLEANEAFSHALEPMSLRLMTGRVRFMHGELQRKWEAALFETHATALAHKFAFTDRRGKDWSADLMPWHPVVELGEELDKKMILAVFHETPAQPRAQLQPGSMASTARLTRAEVEVLAGLLKGLPAKAIASRRSASVNTVRSQIVAILEKTGYNSQKELMASFSTSTLPDSAFSSSMFDSQFRESTGNGDSRFPQASPPSSSGPPPAT